MRLIESIKKWFTAMGRVFRRELSLIVHDAGVLLFFVALPLAYPVVYTLIYNPEVVRKIPVAVVDESMTADSRYFVQKASASPGMEIYAYCPNMADARELMAEGKVFGIMQIQHDYGRNIGNGEPAHVAFYADMSLLLRYRTFVSALTDLQLDIISEVTGEKISAGGLASLAGATGGMPVKSESNFLGVTLLGGTSRERRRRNGGIDPRQVNGVPASAMIWGKALCYTVFYIPLTIYILRFIPEIFNLPHYGNPVVYLLFAFPLLLSSAFLGLTLNCFMKERESGFILIVFTSVIFLFLSGLTWPRYAMGPLWTWVGNAVPAVWGVEGFIRINSNAASLAEVGRDYIGMWVLAAIYMCTAWLVARRR